MNAHEPFKDYYKILQVEPEATTEEIRFAYRKLAKQSHPDSNNSQSSVQSFQEIHEAYEVLKEPQTRDQYLRSWKNRRYEKERQAQKQNLKKIRIESQVVYYRHLPNFSKQQDPFAGFESAYQDLERTWNMRDDDLTTPAPVKIHDESDQREGLRQLVDELYNKRLKHRDIDSWEFQGDLLIQSFGELGNNVADCLETVRSLLHDLPEHADNFRTGYAIYSINEGLEIWNRDSLTDYARLILTLEELYNQQTLIDSEIQPKIGRIDFVLHIRRLFQTGFRGAGISRLLHDEVKPREIDSILKVLGCR